MSSAARTDRARELRAQLNDLTALVSMPAMWRGREIPEVVATVADALFSLLRPEFLYVEYDDGSEDAPHAAVRPRLPREAEGLGAELRDRLASERTLWDPAELDAVRLVELDPGLQPDLQADDWFVVVGTRAGTRDPTEFDELLVSVGVEQAALAVEMIRLLERARVASRTKSAFLATVSHELRTPLNAIIGYADLLLEGIPEAVPGPAAEQVERIGVSARHLLGLVDQILTYTKSEAGHEEVLVESVDLAELTDEVASLVEPLASRKGLTFRVDTPDHASDLRTDRQKVRQILTNLLNNAVKYTGEGEVRLEVERDVDGEVRFRVRDTGPGIPADELETIFAPFERRTPRTDDPGTGTGLGLAVARELAHLLGGKLVAESEVGRGSVFTLTLPPEPPGPERTEGGFSRGAVPDPEAEAGPRRPEG